MDTVDEPLFWVVDTLVSLLLLLLLLLVLNCAGIFCSEPDLFAGESKLLPSLEGTLTTTLLDAAVVLLDVLDHIPLLVLMLGACKRLSVWLLATDEWTLLGDGGISVIVGALIRVECLTVVLTVETLVAFVGPIWFVWPICPLEGVGEGVFLFAVPMLSDGLVGWHISTAGCSPLGELTSMSLRLLRVGELVGEATLVIVILDTLVTFSEALDLLAAATRPVCPLSCCC